MSDASKAPAAKSAGKGGRRTQVAISVFVALGIGLGYAYAVPAAAGAPVAATPAKATPDNAATVACPIVTGTGLADAAAYSPSSQDPQVDVGKAEVFQLGTNDALATLNTPGSYSIVQSLSGDVTNLADDSLPVAARAAGDLAPGFTAAATLESGAAGTDGYGLASAACAPPDTSFWFIGAGTDANPLAQLDFMDTDELTSQVNLAEYDSSGQMSGAAQTANQGLLVQAGDDAAPPGQLINPASPPGAIALHVTATTGRVTAGLLAGDSKGGGRDFVPSQVPATSLVIPGIPAAPAGATVKLQLILMATDQDADVTLKWTGNSSFVPSVTVPHLSAGHVQTVDISAVPAAGESGALEIDSTGNTPIIGAIKVTESSGGSTDTAYLTPVAPLTGDSVVAVNRPGSSVLLTNQGSQPAQVQIATSTQTGLPSAAGTPTGAPSTPSTPGTSGGSGTLQSKTVTVPPRTTLAVPLTPPAGSSQFAIVVTPLGGAAQVYAARVMTGAAPLITIQPMYTAPESVSIPPVRADLSGTVPQN